MARAFAFLLGVGLLASTLATRTRAADVGPLCSCGAPCDLTLDFAVGLDEVFEACNTIVVGDGFTVAAGTTVTLRAGQRVDLGNGVDVESTAQLIVELDPALFCDTSVDLDGDGFNECLDCNDAASSCTTDCADIDGDTRPDCTDACLDADRDRYGYDNTGQTIGSGFLTVGECTIDGGKPCDLGPVCIDTDCDDGDSLINPGASEACNGADDDCDTLVDGNDPSNEIGPFNSNQLGVCSGTRMSCVAAAWQDDYTSVPLFGLFEEPDGSFLDENCDGIDGTVSEAIFVTPTGANISSCGTQESPCASVSYGLSRALGGSKPHVYLGVGNYNETLNLVNSVSIYGGFDTAWVRGERTVFGHTATINGGLYSPESAYLVVRARNVNAEIADVVLQGPHATQQSGSGAGRSSHVVHAISSSLGFERVSILQGNGAAGANGSNGSNASSFRAPGGSDGGDADSYPTFCDADSRGVAGSRGGGSCSSSSLGGHGGSGGLMDTDCGFPPDLDATAGESGDDANVWALGLYGAHGAGGLVCGAGGDGLDGRIVNGDGGAGGPAGGKILSGYWFGHDGGAGGLGAEGGGGGGGGGSGGCDVDTDAYGAGGGGGGTGGCRANSAGGGGRGGGGSFGIYASNSVVSVFDSIFFGGHGGKGGNGGRGGAGQPGGFGGDGGLGAGGAKAGGRGGDGGHGGHSGGGGGGAGGAACHIYRSGTTLNSSGNSGTAGVAGSGGLGGVQGGTDGNAGLPGAHGSEDPGTSCINVN